MFLTDIHRLRGLAIVMIVATHCLSFFSWDQHPWGEAFARDLLDDSTVIFVFISGFLFQCGSNRFVYREYLKTKWRNVLLPYLLMATPAIAYTVLREPAAQVAGGLEGWPAWAEVGYLYIYGGAHLNYALWFIPVIAIYYAAAGLLLRLDRIRFGYAVLIVLLPLSLVMHRPTYSHGHNLGLALYFLSAYVIGMACSRYRARLLPMLDRHLAPLIVLLCVGFVAHLLLSTHHGKYVSTEPFEHQGQVGLIDWIYLQKLLMTIVLLGLMRTFQTRAAPLLDRLADVSFTIYFIHLYVIFAVEWAIHFRRVEVQLDYLLALLAFAIAASSLVALGSRKLLPGVSRSMVGS